MDVSVIGILHTLKDSCNRVGDVHKGILVQDLICQYQHAYMGVAAKYPNKKLPNIEVNKAFSLIKTKGSPQYKGTIRLLAKIESQELWDIFERIFSLASEEVKGAAKANLQLLLRECMPSRITLPSLLSFKSVFSRSSRMERSL
jgi:hypothetical protein